MLYWALVFLVIALIAGVLGFTGVALASAGLAKVLFVIFLVLFLVSLVSHLARGRVYNRYRSGQISGAVGSQDLQPPLLFDPLFCLSVISSKWLCDSSLPVHLQLALH